MVLECNFELPQRLVGYSYVYKLRFEASAVMRLVKSG